MKDSKDEENVVGLIVASASTGVLAILAVAAVIVCCKHHSNPVEEEEEEGEKTNQQLKCSSQREHDPLSSWRGPEPPVRRAAGLRLHGGLQGGDIRQGRQ